MDSLGLAESEAKEADVIIIVACAVRQTAVDRVLGKAKNWKGKKILVTGCVLDADKKKFADKGIKIFGPGDFKTLKKYLSCHSEPIRQAQGKLREESIRVRSFAYAQDDSPKTSRYHKVDRDPDKSASSGLITSQYVPIMTGCNNFCSYCAVPYTRGREKSRLLEDIIKDVKKLISAGHKEIMLLGQNVNSYAISQTSNLKPQTYNLELKKSKTDFTKLLEKLNKLEGDFEISFTSNHPKDMTDDIIEAVATLPKVKKEIHLPLQSGSNKVLQSMNRPYTIKQYLDIVKKIKKIGDIDITTDVIVGYPTETEEDFENTVEIFKKVKFKQAYINKYSPRSGTAAYKLGDPIKWSEKQRRWRILNDLVKR